MRQSFTWTELRSSECPQWGDFPYVTATWKMFGSCIVLSNVPGLLAGFKSLPISLAEVISPLSPGQSPQCTSVNTPHA